MLQQVSGVTAGQLLRFSTYALTWSCDKESKGNCSGNTSGDPSPMHLRIGIDPNGGTDAKAASIVWSAEENAWDAWTLIQVEAVAASSSVTVFVYAYPDYRSQDNNVYVDDASLVAASARILPIPVAAAAVETAVAPTTPVTTGDWPFSGTLVGNHGGAYADFPVTFASADPVTLVLQVMPFDMVIARGTGFTVYGPNGLAATAARSGAQNEMQVTFTPMVGAEYLVQVFNYFEGLPIYYSLQK